MDPNKGCGTLVLELSSFHVHGIREAFCYENGFYLADESQNAPIKNFISNI